MARAKPIQIRLSDRVSISLARIRKGSFEMGQRGEYADEEPVHRVVISSDFYLSVYPVTQAQFAATHRMHYNSFPGKPDHPAESMNWHEAKAFCAWLNGLPDSGIPDGYVADLPTEAEWEYACRAGTTAEYYTGDGEGVLKSAGWFDQNSGRATHPVGELEPNKFGLHDMHGNVWEWCLDAWDDQAYRKRVSGASDPRVESENKHSLRVIRGGSWDFSARYCRSAYRYRRRPDGRYGNQGFRLGLFPGTLAPANYKLPTNSTNGHEVRRNPK